MAQIINPNADRTRALTTSEWAEKLGCHPESLRRAIRSGRLKATKDPLSLGPTYVITVGAMQDFLAYRSQGPVVALTPKERKLIAEFRKGVD